MRCKGVQIMFNLLFSVTQEKTRYRIEPNDYEQVNINGVIGNIRTIKLDTARNAGNFSTDLHWNNEGIFYRITGFISENDAIETACSLK